MSKPLVAPTRYVLACHFGDGSQREFIFAEYRETDGVPTPAPPLKAFDLYELVNGVRYCVAGWDAPEAA